MSPADLTDEDRAVLDFAARTYRSRGAQEAAIFDELGMRPTRYWQRVNRLLDEPAAEAYAPTTVRRLQRLRDARQRARSPRRLGHAA